MTAEEKLRWLNHFHGKRYQPLYRGYLGDPERALFQVLDTATNKSVPDTDLRFADADFDSAYLATIERAEQLNLSAAPAPKPLVLTQLTLAI